LLFRQHFIPLQDYRSFELIRAGTHPLILSRPTTGQLLAFLVDLRPLLVIVSGFGFGSVGGFPVPRSAGPGLLPFVFAFGVSLLAVQGFGAILFGVTLPSSQSYVYNIPLKYVFVKGFE